MKKTNFGLIAAILFLTLAGGSAFAETPQLPGMVEGTGTHFEVTDSTYLNISLNSSEPIKAMLQSAPEMVMMYVEPVSEASSTTITLSGFAPNAAYYKYEDDFHNPIEFMTDEEGNYSYTQDLSKEHVVFIQTEKSTKFIRDDATGGDCYSIGTWDASTKTCTLTTDVIDLIQIDDNGIVLEGAGHSVSGTGINIYSEGKTGITIKNLNIESISYGIYLVNCNNSNITSNTISKMYTGIYLLNSGNNTIEKNISNLNIAGVFLWFSDYTTVRYNTLSNNSVYGIIIASNNSQVYNNNFIENGITQNGAQALVYGTGNVFNLPKPTGGNYWSDHNNYDEDNDGFADTVYFFTGGQDNLPLVEPFSPEPGPEDTTPPITIIALSGTEGNNEWHVSDVEVTLTAIDEGGTVALTEYSFDEANWNTYTAPFAITDEGTATVYYRSTDDSGNVEETKSETVKVDKTTPAIAFTQTPEPNANGWNNTNVTVQFTCNDGLSEIDTCTQDKTITTEGAAQTITGTATDKAGNTTSTTVTNINIDKTTPSTAITTPTAYGLYPVGEALDFTASDSLSGVESKIGKLTNTDGTTIDVDSGYQPTPGVYTLVVKAIDNAGNTAESDSVYFVVYDPNGGFATGGGWINPDNESTLPSDEEKANFGFVAKYKKGISTGNLEFQYKDAGINFKSTTIDWLVINGTSAQFQGTGTINGEDLYTFRVRVKDEGEPGAGTDSFNIKIWEGTDTEADPVHSAKNTLKGGNIVIHKKSHKK